MRIIFLSLAISLLTACSSEINLWEITAANKLCSERGGVDHIDPAIVNWVICADGYLTEIKKGK